ncbi:hypothetical protein EON65_40690 [archaeon]|nr:MAG: hypothetical protein EON65_40690 [archaeon]
MMFMRDVNAGFLRHLGSLIEECEYADEVKQYIHAAYPSLAHIHDFAHMHYHVDFIRAVNAYTNDNVDDLAEIIRRTHRLPIEFDSVDDCDDTSTNMVQYIVEEIMLVDTYKDLNIETMILQSPHLPTIIKILSEDVWYLESIYKKYMDISMHPIQHSLVYALLFTNQELFTFVSQWGNAEFELLRTPIRIINTLTKPLVSHPGNYTKLAALFEAYMRDKQQCLSTLRYLLCFMYGLQNASMKVVCDSVDLLALQQKLHEMLITLFQMDSMDDRDNVIKLLRRKHFPFDEPLPPRKNADGEDSDDAELERLHAMTSNTLCFAEDGLMCFAMEYEVRILSNQVEDF